MQPNMKRSLGGGAGGEEGIYLVSRPESQKDFLWLQVLELESGA